MSEQTGPVIVATAPPAIPTPIPEHPNPVAVAARLVNGVDLDPFVKALIYGDPGSGKSVLAAGAPKPLIIDTENSTEALRDWPELARECKIIRLQTWNDLDEVAQALRAGDPEFADRETLVIDTISELQRRNLDELLIEEARRNAARDPFLAHQGDYKKSGEMLRRMTTTFRDLPMHMVVLAHAREQNDNGRMYVRPDLTPKLADTFRGVFGLEGFLFVKSEGWDEQGFVNVLQTRSNPSVQAKSRYRHLPPIIERPTFDTILEASRKYLEEKTSTVDATASPEEM